jgi:hypothetical protein
LVEAITKVYPNARTLLHVPSCRGVSIDRIGAILEGGVDVRPVDAPIYLDALSKALEYGGKEKALMIFDRAKLDRTFREISARTPQADIDVIAQTFPTIRRSTDGSKLWCSRLPQDDTALATDYEASYAYWIPANPFDALRAVIAYGPTGTNLLARVSEAISSAARHGWQTKS